MKNSKKILFLAFLLLSFILLFSACDSTPKQKKQQPQKVITKKILPPMQKINTPKKAETEPVKVATPKKAKTDIGKDSKTEPTKTATQKKAKTATVIVAKSDDKTITKNINLKDDIEKDKTTEYYISEGKLDPFISPIAKENSKERKKIINRKLTPLEKLDLSQIKLVAVISMKSKKKNVAMVQESSGKGYMVKVGTYIGTNNGRIIEIRNDEIIIKERIKNFKGVYEDHLKPMKLQKKDNG
jgi:type IV pilus assembly protein PilP